MSWKDGAIYSGFWQYGYANGQGKFQYADGGVYNGDWLDNKKSGDGEYLSDKTNYNGEWKNNAMHGYGVETLKNGTKFEGTYYQSKK